MNDAVVSDQQNPAERSARAGEPGGRAIALVDNRIDSRDLFISGREIVIAHGNEHYRLRLTAQNKLILTK